MKKILFLFMLVLCCACEDESVDPTVMPEATATGENTLGCLIGGWVYSSGRFGKPMVTTASDEKNFYIEIYAKVGLYTDLRLVLVNPRQGATCKYTQAWFAGGGLGDGEAHIIRMDGKVISGTFSGESVKDGRFDIRYYQETGDGEGIY